MGNGRNGESDRGKLPDGNGTEADHQFKGNRYYILNSDVMSDGHGIDE
jgi:hypothetical protein